MFYGTYNHVLDDKNRLMIPKKFRNSLSVKVFIMKGYDGAINLMAEDEFEAYVKKLNEMSFNKKDTRTFLRIQLASTYELEVDKLGRIQIPNAVISKYNLTKEICVVGAGDHLELWSRQAYEDYDARNYSKFEDIAEHLGDE